MNKGFSFSIESKNDIIIFHIQGYINNLNAKEIEKSVKQEITGGARRFIFDLGGAEVNSIGLAIFIGIVEELRSLNGLVVFCQLSEIMQETFGITGLFLHARCEDNLDNAILHITNTQEN
jgi:anti-anti-sigma factor